ncbi:Hypothetical predicted protein, partial [Paramuricea clavata]
MDTDQSHTQFQFELEGLQRLLILSDPEFENNLFTNTPSDSPSTISTNPISTSTLPQFTPPVDTPTNISQSPGTMDTTTTSTQIQPTSTPIQSPNAIPTSAQTTSTLTLPADMGQPSNIPTTSQPIIPQTPLTHQITTTTPQPPITPNNTTTMFNKLVELHHHKNDHQRQLTILNKHITNHTAPAGLNISIQPWVQLSPKLKEAWDTGIQNCMSHLTDILHQHHSEESSKIDGQISSLSTKLNDNLPQELSSTIIHIASTHRPPSKRKTTPKSNTKHQPKRPKSTATTSHPAKPENKQVSQKWPHHQQHREPLPPTSKPPLRVPPPPSNTTPLHPPMITIPALTSIMHSSIKQRLMGKQTQFPTIYN